MNLQEQIKRIQQNQPLVDQLMRSADGQKLLSMLTTDGGGQLQSAIDAAAKGNTAAMVHMIADLMQSDEGSRIAHKINDQFQ